MESYRHPHRNTPAVDVQESSCRLRLNQRLRRALTAAEEHSASGSSSPDAFETRTWRKPDTRESANLMRRLWCQGQCALSPNGPAFYSHLSSAHYSLHMTFCPDFVITPSFFRSFIDILSSFLRYQRKIWVTLWIKDSIAERELGNAEPLTSGGPWTYNDYWLPCIKPVTNI